MQGGSITHGKGALSYYGPQIIEQSAREPHGYRDVFVLFFFLKKSSRPKKDFYCILPF